MESVEVRLQLGVVKAHQVFNQHTSMGRLLGIGDLSATSTSNHVLQVFFNHKSVWVLIGLFDLMDTLVTTCQADSIGMICKSRSYSWEFLDERESRSYLD